MGERILGFKVGETGGKGKKSGGVINFLYLFEYLTG